MAKFYSGKFRPKNPEKYVGDLNNIKYRSHWERQFMRWLDDSPSVKKWGSECVVIPYRCATDNAMHRYFMDFVVEFEKGPAYLIEIKPFAQTQPPKKSRSQRVFTEAVMTYAKNQSKWKQAKMFAEDRGMIFEVFTEKTLESLGIKLMVSKQKKHK